jgi:hypothetical protein
MAGTGFFDGIRQTPVEFRGHQLLAPNFTYDASVMTAVFPASYSALRKLLPDRRFVPARLAPGVGIVAVSAFEYRNTDVGAYNEVALAIMLNEPRSAWNAPGRALVGQHRRRQYHAFVFQLPVTTELAQVTGQLIGFPKFVGTIDFDECAGVRGCRLAEGGEHVLTLRAQRVSTIRSEQLQTFAHLWMDGQPQSVEFKINALQFGQTVKPGAARVELTGSHPAAATLDRLLLSRRSIAYRFTSRMEAVQFDPDRINLALLAEGVRTIRSPVTVAAGG